MVHAGVIDEDGDRITCILTANTQARRTATSEVVRIALSKNASWVGITEAVDAEFATDVWGRNGYEWCSKGGGTGIAVKATHMPRVRRWSELESKRATIVQMDYGDQKVAVASIRLQPNMDVADAKRDEEAKQVMREIHELHEENDAVVVMGDWNQVAVPSDRLTESEGQWVETKRCRGLQLREIKMAGYIDTFREHTEAGGWTHRQRTRTGICKSRLDYIFVRSDRPTLRVEQADVIKLPEATTHDAVAVCVRGLMGAEPLWDTRAVFRRVDLGACSQEQKSAFCAQVHARLRKQGEQLRKDLQNPTPRSVSRATKRWTSWIIKAANDNLEWSKQRMSDQERQDMLRLRAKRVRQAMRCAKRPDAKSEGWTRKWAAVTRRLDPDLRHPPDPGSAEWTVWNARLLRRKKRIRRLRKSGFRSPGKGPIRKADTDRYIQKILRGGRANELDSVTRPDGTLAYEPDEVKRTVERHIRSIAGRQAEAPVEIPDWYVDSDQRNQARHEQYQGAEDHFSAEEVLEVLRALKWRVAPGPDGVPGGLLKLLVTKDVDGAPMATDEEVQETAEAMRDLTWAIFVVEGRIPECWDSTTKPLWKKEGSKDPANIRPIALQNAITKIPAAIIAKRLIHVFDKHQILHPAQEAFIKNGRSENVLWTVLNIWSEARRRKSAYYNVMYDWIKAYDSLPWWALERAMDRLCIPPMIRKFVMGSLERARTRVRTAYGLTEWIYMLRGVKQGDPMAPIAYIIAMDILHDQVHHEVNGFKIGAITVATKGYADDMWTGNDMWDRLAKGHAVIVKVCDFLEIGIHPKKTALIGFEEDGSPINLDRELPMPEGSPTLRATHKPQKLLGLWVQPPDRWTAQEGVLGFMVHNTAMALRHSRLNLEQAVYALRTYLWPKLAYRLRFFPLKQTTARGWQQALNNATTRLGGGTRRIKPEALAYAMDYPMLYVQATRALAMETCRRLESKGSSGVASRLHIQKDQSKGKELTGMRGTILKLHLGALRSMGLALVWCRNKIPTPPSPDKPRKLVLDGKTVKIFAGNQGPPVQGWAEACVDGSLRKEDGHGHAGWAVIFVTDKLKQNWRTWVRDAAPCTYVKNLKRIQGIQGRLTYDTQASYDPELEALAWALLALPATMNVRIHIDNQGVIKAVQNQETVLRVDRTKRYHLLKWVRTNIEERNSRGREVELKWIKAHQGEVTDHLVAANEVADVRAKHARLMGTPKDFDTRQVGAPWRLHACERNVRARCRMPLRSKTRAILDSRAMEKWKVSRSQAPGWWDAGTMRSWLKEWSARGFRRGLLMRLCTGAALMTEHREGVREYRIPCTCDQGDGEPLLSMEHAPTCEHEDTKPIWTRWRDQVTEKLAQAGRTLERPDTDLTEDEQREATRRVELLKLEQADACNRIWLYTQTLRPDRWIHYLNESDLQAAARSNLWGAARQTSAEWRKAVELTLAMTMCECKDLEVGQDHEMLCPGWARTTYPAVMKTMMRLFQTETQLVHNPLQVLRRCKAWWTQEDVLHLQSDQPVVWCIGSDNTRDSLQHANIMIRNNQMPACVVISGETMEGDMPSPDNVLLTIPEGLTSQCQCKTWIGPDAAPSTNTSVVRVWILGAAEISPESGIIMEDLTELRQSWTQKGLRLNEQIWAKVTDGIAMAQVQTKRQWAEQEMIRLAQDRRDGRAFYGLWDNASRQGLMQRGMMKEHWKATADAITLATLEAYRDTVKSVRSRLCPQTAIQTAEVDAGQDEEAEEAVDEDAQDAAPLLNLNATQAEGDE